jgi:hypothetical protein
LPPSVQKVISLIQFLRKDAHKKFLSNLKRLEAIKTLQSLLDDLNRRLFSHQVVDNIFVHLFAVVFACSSAIAMSSLYQWMALSEKYVLKSTAPPDEIKSACVAYKNIHEKEKER